MAKIYSRMHSRTICLMDFWKGMQVSKILEKFFLSCGEAPASVQHPCKYMKLIFLHFPAGMKKEEIEAPVGI